MENNKYQALREKIIEANPEIKDLVFGCETRTNTKAKSELLTIVKPLGKTGEFVVTYPDGTQGCYKPEELKIIGRPIRLADVLLAQEPHEKISSLHAVNAFNCYQFLQMWNLKDDNLDNQSEETKEFLYKLLVVS